jgi:HAD superfamily hydrolase (TIGR01490 family)
VATLAEVAIAFFDFDRTLIASNSASMFVRAELRAGHITMLQALRAMTWMARYHLGMVALDSAVAQALEMLAGGDEQALRGRSETFYEQELRALYRPGALEAIASHRQAGDLIVLLTASPSYVSELVRQDLTLDGILCNRFEVDAGGVFTGRTVGGLCFGAGKLSHAQAFASERKMPLEDCSFYTDSFSDLPVLLAVGNPVAVNPDHRLRREAKRRGWKVVDWGHPRARRDARRG